MLTLKQFSKSLKIRKTSKYSRNKKNLELIKTFKISKGEVSNINNLLKATGPDTIPPKLVKLTANIVDSYFCNIKNKDLESNYFSDGAKIVSVRPIYRKKSRHQVETYRPVSILNSFTKIC